MVGIGAADSINRKGRTTLEQFFVQRTPRYRFRLPSSPDISNASIRSRERTPMSEKTGGIPLWAKVLIGISIAFIGLVVLAFLAGLLMPTTPN